MATDKNYVAQVGGAHYQADFQHWDLMALANQSYLSATAQKYLTRAHKKNGRQDLEKAVTYMTKILTLLANEGVPIDPRPWYKRALERLQDSFGIKTRRMELWETFAEANSDVPQDILLLIKTLYFAEERHEVEYVRSAIQDRLNHSN